MHVVALWFPLTFLLQPSCSKEWKRDDKRLVQLQRISKVDHCMRDNFKENTQYEVDKSCSIPNSQNLRIEVSMNRSTTLHEVLNKLIILCHSKIIMFAFNLKDIIELYSFQKINSLLCFSLWQSTVGLMKSYMLSDMATGQT